MKRGLVVHRAPRHHLPHHGGVALGMRPPRWQRWAVHTTMLALLATGLAWLMAHSVLHAGDDGSPLEAWALRLHGIAAYAFLIALGSMTAMHIATGWRARMKRRSGASLLALGSLLSLSALALYYGPEPAHAATSLVHWAAGLALLPLLWLHVLSAKRGARR